MPGGLGLLKRVFPGLYAGEPWPLKKKFPGFSRGITFLSLHFFKTPQSPLPILSKKNFPVFFF